MKLLIFCVLVLYAAAPGKSLDTSKYLGYLETIVEGAAKAITKSKTVVDYLEKDGKLTVEKVQKDLLSVVREYPLQLPETLHAKEELRELGHVMDQLQIIFNDAAEFYNRTSSNPKQTHVYENQFYVQITHKVPEHLDNINLLMFPETSFNGDIQYLQHIIANQYHAERKQICGKDSPRRLVYKLFNKILMTEILAYSLVKTAYERKSLHEHVSHKIALAVYQQKLSTRLLKYFEGMDKSLATVSREIKACDAKGGYANGSAPYIWFPRTDYKQRTKNTAPGKAISLEWSTSDVWNENKVVTGLRFVRIDKVLYIQVKQAKIYPNFVVGESEWKEVDPIFTKEKDYAASILYNNRAHLDAIKFPRWATDEEKDQIEKDTQLESIYSDQHTYYSRYINRWSRVLSDDWADYYAQRELDVAYMQARVDILLDDTSIHYDGPILVGARFRYVRVGSKYVLAVEAGYQMYNSTTGGLYNLTWSISDETNAVINRKTELKYEPKKLGCNGKKPSDPVQQSISRIDMENGVILTMDYDKMNGEERFMTYFDGTAVEADVPLRGIGLYHKAIDQCHGGFIALRLIDLDHKDYFKWKNINSV